ncbi:MAG: hypothetical protein WCF33_10320 [Pseudonocardiaceae bacterium]
MSTPIDITAVTKVVTAALQTPPFQITGAALQSPPITVLFLGHLGGDVLKLDRATLAGQTDTSITVTGTLVGSLHGLIGLTASARFTVSGGVGQVQLTLTGLPTGWKPSSTFSSLRGTITDAFTYASPHIVLDSLNADALPTGFPAGFGFAPFAPATAAALVRGLSIGATVTLVDPPPGLGLLAGGTT